MNYTKNHHLPQWEESDRIFMSDFNDAMANIETGLTQGPAGAAEAAAMAQATAGQALADAAKAQAKADAAYSPDQPPYVIGTYAGNGRSVTIQLGFRPRFVLITGSRNGYTYLYSRMVGPETATGQVTFRYDGFTVTRNDSDASMNEMTPHLIDAETTYSYIAFR